jgi:hypothetical protein
MTRRSTVRPLRTSVLVALLALATTLVATPVAGPVEAMSRSAIPDRRLASPSAIIPGSVDRSSVHLRATYSTTLRLSYGTRRFDVHSAATITNASGAAIDRVELNTAVARLGSMQLVSVSIDGRGVTGRVVDQTIVIPLGGILPVGASTVIRVRYRATLRTSLSGSSWLFTRANGIVDAYRWLPWVSRQTPFDRPNHGDPFVTPTSPFVRLTVITDRPLVIATTGDRVYRSADGLSQRFEARDVRDVTVTAAPDFHTRETTVGDTTIRAYDRSSTHAAATLDAAVAAFKAIQAKLGDYPYPTFKVVQSAGGYGMESPRLIWIPYGVSSTNLRYLVAHETAHQWFYGLVGNDQSRQPFADEAAADFVARYVTGTRRSSRCPTGRLDLTIYEYTSRCYYEKVYIQGGNLIDAARREIGSTAFWAALRGYVTANRHRLVSNATLLSALDRATPKDLAALLFARRFPRIY